MRHPVRHPVRPTAALPTLAVFGALLVAGCTGVQDTRTDLGPELDAALDHLLSLRDAQGRWPPGLVPLVVDAAAAARKDLQAWPEPVPLAQQVAWPDEGLGFLPSLRPLHAVAQVAAAAGDEPQLMRVRERVLAGSDGQQFGDPALLNDDAFALLVLGRAGLARASDIGRSVDHLLANRSADGGWSWAVGGAGETDMTGMVLAGVSEAGQIHRVEPRGVLDFLATTRTAGGGHSLMAGGEANCDSTVWAIRAQGRLALAAEPAAWEYLLGLQRDDGGFAYAAGGDANTLCTAEAAVLLGMAVHREVPLPAGLEG